METRGEKNNLVDTALRQEGTHGARDTRAVRAACQPDDVAYHPNATHQPDAASQSDAALQPNATHQPDVALVLEGGSFRGIFTAGVLDVLLEHGIVDFTGVWGTSAGAINAVSFKSRQIGRAMRVMLAFRDDRRFMSFWSLATTGNIAGSEFMYEEIQNHLDPCDCDTFNANPMQMYAVASDVTFGTSAYLHVQSLPKDIWKVQASASMPLVSKTVEQEGHRYLDGGTADSIPFASALRLPGSRFRADYPVSKRALVIVTQDRNYVKGTTNEQMTIRSHRYDAFPYYLEALETRANRYNACREQLWQLEREGQCLVIAPPKPVEVKVNERSGEALLTLYLQGRQKAEERFEEIRTFVAGK